MDADSSAVDDAGEIVIGRTHRECVAVGGETHAGTASVAFGYFVGGGGIPVETVVAGEVDEAKRGGALILSGAADGYTQSINGKTPQLLSPRYTIVRGCVYI